MNAVRLLHKLWYCVIVLADVHSDGTEQKEGSPAYKECLGAEELDQAARDVGAELRCIAVRNQSELESARIGPLLRNISYPIFSTACSNLLRRTVNSVANRWDQTLLVFANYMQLREALRGDTSQQNEVALYIGQYLSDMGFQSWVSWMRQNDLVSTS